MHQKQFIVITVQYKEEKDGRWTAECKEFGTATFGDSLEEAKQNILEAVELHINTLEEVGECERFLKENNIKVYPHPPKAEVSINAPIDANIFSQPLVHEFCGA
ncbi:MAG: type II toxin-antitoxin system HicB family antitoxin [Bacteroidota bacterium]|nr:type II toxin-antitoxin system HicB family antitoxin [Bacteroidota bacterium]